MLNLLTLQLLSHFPFDLKSLFLLEKIRRNCYLEFHWLMECKFYSSCTYLWGIRCTILLFHDRRRLYLLLLFGCRLLPSFRAARVVLHWKQMVREVLPMLICWDWFLLVVWDLFAVWFVLIIGTINELEITSHSINRCWQHPWSINNCTNT